MTIRRHSSTRKYTAIVLIALLVLAGLAAVGAFQQRHRGAVDAAVRSFERTELPSNRGACQEMRSTRSSHATLTYCSESASVSSLR